ncbi:MAG: hypothetical protein MRY78_03200 [Saprospiraceae bacterium]|nr:hypothetical protein [Saprospiraceae bacterium]
MSSASSKAAVSDQLTKDSASRANRIMIIIWSWQYGGMPSQMDEWSVEGNSGDKVVRMDLKMSSSAKETLREKLQEYAQQGEVFLFLHRRHGYDQKTLKEILQMARSVLPQGHLIKSFLFGEGNDKIYIVNQTKGLLGTRGTFSAKLQAVGIRQATYVNAIADKDKKVIKRKHFDFVWHQYSHNFKAKIFELKEDLFRSLSPFLFITEIQAGAVYNYIKQEENKLLMLRLLSFIGKIRKGSNLETQLKEFEQQHKRSYFFDDCHLNLKMTYGEQEAQLYDSLVDTISKKLLAYEPNLNFTNIRDQFDELLEAMPGSTYN